MTPGFRMAWRNIWRNRRRTLISAASVAFAVLFAIFMSSFQKGGWDRVLDNVVRFYFGYAQVHAQGYWEEQTIDRSIDVSDPSIVGLEDASGRVFSHRIESFALASTGPSTTGVLLSGVQPDPEDRITSLRSRLVQGEYLQEGSESVLIAQGLAQELRVGVGDTVVLLSQGYHGVTAAGKFPVSGIVSFGSPELNKLMVYLPLPAAQAFFGAEGRVTSMVADLPDSESVPDALKSIRAALDEGTYEVLGWEDLLPDLVQARALDSAGSNIILLILYLIIAFGLFGTVLMMTKERQYEFGVLIAIGMHRGQLARIVWMEIILLSIVGALAGMVMAIPVVFWFNVNPVVFTGDFAEAYLKFGVEPIFPTAIDPRIFLNQALIVFGMSLAMVIYPWLRIRHLSPVASMRH